MKKPRIIAEIHLIVTEDENGVRTLTSTTEGLIEDFAEMAVLLSEKNVQNARSIGLMASMVHTVIPNSKNAKLIF